MAADELLNPPRTAYTPDALIACQRVLGTLVKRVGAYGPQLVVIGGLVPTLLLPQVEPGQFGGESHPGTNDVDIVLDLGVRVEGDEEFYTILERVLIEGEFTRMPRADGQSPSVWQWVRKVNDISIAVEFLSERTSQQVQESNARPTIGRLAVDQPIQHGDTVGVLRIRGAHLAYGDAVQKTLDVELLDNGGMASVDVWVANLLPFVALKAFAVRQREKDKDAADLVWLLNNWSGGPAGAATEALQSAVRTDSDVTDALGLLRTDFESTDRNGCCSYARFQLGKETDPRSERWIRRCRDAHGTIGAFLNAWDAQEVAPKPTRLV
jgi:hypothetical protein